MNLDKFEELFDLDFDDSIYIYAEYCKDFDKDLTELEFIEAYRKNKLENIMEEIKDEICSTDVELHEGNRDYMSCPLCGDTASVTYHQGSRLQSLSMSSIDHTDDCPYKRINTALELLKDL